MDADAATEDLSFVHGQASCVEHTTHYDNKSSVMPMRPVYLLLACVTSVLVGCDRSAAPVQFSIPDEFRGVFEISVDRQHGVRPVMSNGVWMIVVPTDAHLVIDDDRFLTRWHSEAARYYSGKPVPDENTSATNVVALRSLFSDG